MMYPSVATCRVRIVDVRASWFLCGAATADARRHGGGAMDYLSKNQEYWSGLYDAPNVESFIFRFYGRILRFDYGIDGSNHERLLDFGCGQGAALRFFDQRGFNVHGVDIADKDLDVARRVLPHRRDQLMRVDPTPNPDAVLFGGNFD